MCFSKAVKIIEFAGLVVEVVSAVRPFDMGLLLDAVERDMPVCGGPPGDSVDIDPVGSQTNVLVINLDVTARRVDIVGELLLVRL